MGNDSQQKYFQMMRTLTEQLSSIPVELVEQAYNNQAFGSWWFVFKKNSLKYRIVFDGRDRMLRIESQDRKEWRTEKEITNDSDDTLITDVISIIQSHSK